MPKTIAHLVNSSRGSQGFLFTKGQKPYSSYTLSKRLAVYMDMFVLQKHPADIDVEDIAAINNKMEDLVVPSITLY
jgi:hypothetical protein